MDSHPMIQLPAIPQSLYCKHCAQILSREKFYPGCPSCCKKCFKKRQNARRKPKAA
jgi:hypothetical protein